jgi:3-hydroxybutyryl-CoA dehydrogenase
MTERLDIAVVGAGLMGHGIAQVFAVHGDRVSLHDPDAGTLASARERIAANLSDLGLDPSAVDHVRITADLEDAVGDADFVFEAAPEDMAVKQELFARLDVLAPTSGVLATNTSVMRVSDIAARMSQPERVVGTHWWNPPYLVPLVEVVEGRRTRPEIVDRTMELLTAVGKTPVHVRKDIPGFIGNRLQHALWRQAIELVDAGVCDARAIDTVVKAAFGPRLAVLGPMENADLVGLDLTLQIHDYVLPTLDPPSEPAEGLRRHVERGELGMKTGRGFRAWAPGEPEEVRRRVLAHLATAWPASVGEGVR